MSNASLPRTEMNKRANIRFMCTTQHASPLEMLDGVCESFKWVNHAYNIRTINDTSSNFVCSRESFENLVLAYDIEQQAEVFVRPYILVVTGDNPMQAAECSSAGLQANRFCRTCCVGGNTKHRASNEGFAEFLEVSLLIFGCIHSLTMAWLKARCATNCGWNC